MFCFVVNPETHSMFLFILLVDFSLNIKKKKKEKDTKFCEVKHCLAIVVDVIQW